ncbi:hypothetical protein Nmel_015159, partial [Mimus melanotis]
EDLEVLPEGGVGGVVGQPPDEDLGEGGVLLHGVHGAGSGRPRPASTPSRAAPPPSPPRRPKAAERRRVPGPYSRLMAAPGAGARPRRARRCRTSSSWYEVRGCEVPLPLTGPAGFCPDVRVHPGRIVTLAQPHICCMYALVHNCRKS